MEEVVRQRDPQNTVAKPEVECQDPTNLLGMLSNSSSVYPIHLFFSSRKMQGLARQFTAFKGRLHSHNITPVNTLADTRAYVENGCESLAVDFAYRHYLINTMLRKSDGSFLWTKLAFEELEHAYSGDTINNILEEIPEGMSALYQRIVECMEKSSREVKLTKGILAWAACYVRNLSLHELQVIIRLDLTSNVLDIERTAEGLCGQLTRVEKSSLVQLTHATVRDFLIGGCPESPFAIERSEAHERLAEVCLLYLGGDELRPPKTRALISGLKSVLSLFAELMVRSRSFCIVSERPPAETREPLLG